MFNRSFGRSCLHNCSSSLLQCKQLTDGEIIDLTCENIPVHLLKAWWRCQTARVGRDAAITTRPVFLGKFLTIAAKREELPLSDVGLFVNP